MLNPKNQTCQTRKLKKLNGIYDFSSGISENPTSCLLLFLTFGVLLHDSRLAMLFICRALDGLFVSAASYGTSI